MSYILSLSLVAVLASVLFLLSERSGTFRQSLAERSHFRRTLYLINILLYLLLVQALNFAVLDYVGLLFSTIHQMYVLVGLLPTIGWAIVYTGMIEGKKPGDSQAEGLAYVIAAEAAKSKAAGEEIPKLIRSEIKRGNISMAGAVKILGILRERSDDIGVSAKTVRDADFLS